jgi:hypothetical protein
MVTLMIVIVDELLNRLLQMPGKIVVLQLDDIFHGTMERSILPWVIG